MSVVETTSQHYHIHQLINEPMKKNFLFVLCLWGGIVSAQSRNHVDYVNPIIGTNSMGHTFPGACAVHGIVQLSPDTDTIPHNIDGVYQKRVYEYCAGYQHKDSSIVGFSHTHFSGTGHSDLGDILLMPVTGKLRLNPGTAAVIDDGYRSRFSHDTEISKPGYYSVMLDDYDIKVELTATPRVGVHKYTFPSADKGRFIMDLVHGIYNYDGKVLWASIRVENDTLITGYRITNGWARTNYTYFAISLSKPIQNYGCIEKAKIKYGGGWGKFDMRRNFPEMAGRKLVAYFDVEPGADKTLEVKVALSAVSTEGAVKNLKAETEGKSFDQIAQETRAEWAKEMDIIEAEGSEDQLTMLYTSLYHTLINPSVYMDVDGNYRGQDNNIHQADGFTNYTIFSLWDTYRALHPLFNIINRKRNEDMINSMLAHYQQSALKALPVWSHMANENWCMIGYHAVSVISDAIAKGLDIDKDLALKAMVSSSTIPYYDNTKEYIDYGYIPHDVNRNGVSITLEYAYDDWAIYQTALRAGNTEIAETYKKRAESYRNLFDKNLGFARPKYKDGRWKENFSLLETHGEGFLEGNSWNYSFYVPHDVRTLIPLMGGDKRFIEKIDSLFTMELPEKYFENTEDVTKEGLIGNYGHGNEPSHHILYLYNWTSQPWKTQYWVREVMNRMYKNDIDGLCGNDDCGQMSAWYIFSAMGFYPVCPGTDQYVLGAPYLPYMKINLENGKTFEIKAAGVSDTHRYVKSVKLNGKPYDKAYITQTDIMNGGTLEFEMSSKPNKKRVFVGDQLPYSLSDGTEIPEQTADKELDSWKDYHVGDIVFIDRSPKTLGSSIYHHIIPNPYSYIRSTALQVLNTLYFSPEDSIPGIKQLRYIIRDYDGVSAKSGNPPAIQIEYSTQWIEKSFGNNDTTKLHHETKGVLYHELTHGYQLEPQGIGTYGTNKTFWAFIEGMADAVRYVNGGFTLADRPKGGHYTDGYRTTGFFFAWLAQTKDKDFLKKINRSTLEVIPWSFDGAIKHVLGEKYNIDDLWEEYLIAMGDKTPEKK